MDFVRSPSFELTSAVEVVGASTALPAAAAGAEDAPSSKILIRCLSCSMRRRFSFSSSSTRLDFLLGGSCLSMIDYCSAALRMYFTTSLATYLGSHGQHVLLC